MVRYVTISFLLWTVEKWERVQSSRDNLAVKKKETEVKSSSPFSGF